MTMTIKSIAIAGTAMFALSACDTMMMTDTATVGGKSYDQLRDEYPDLSAVEFSVLDRDNNGVVDASEEARIGNDDSGPIDEIMVDDT